jgi:hypothetical protein
MDEKLVSASQRILRATQRIAKVTGKAVKLGLRITMASVGSVLMIGGLMLIHPLGQIVLGIPIFALGFIASFKAVFW